MFTIIFGVIFLMTMIGGLLFYFLVIKKNKSSNSQRKTKNDVDVAISEHGTAQSFLPFEDIKYDMIHMGNHKYRAVIEVSSVNYHLKTEGEKEIIEIAFNRFINSLNHPIAIYVQTRVLDYSKMLNTLKTELVKTVQKYPYMEGYANSYFNNMVNINKITGSSKQKKKYIIVPYEESGYLEKLNDEEKLDHSIKNLISRVNVIISNLRTAGFSSKMLNTAELIDLLYFTFNKDSSMDTEAISSGELSIPVVSLKDDKALGMTEE